MKTVADFVQRLRSYGSRILIAARQGETGGKESSDHTGGLAYLHAESFAEIAMDLTSYLRESGRSDLKEHHFETVLAPLLNLYFQTLSYHDAVLLLVRQEHGLNAMTLVRPQLEGLITLLHLLAEGNSLHEVERRIAEYEEWIQVKQWLNSQSSRDLSLSEITPGHEDYHRQVEENYRKIASRYDNRAKDLKRLQNSTSFVRDKPSVARAAGFEDLYRYIVAECSASIHVADYGDRMTPSTIKGFVGYRFRVRSLKETTWPLVLSNLVLLHSVAGLSKFLEIDQVIMPALLATISSEGASP